ncbi:MAG: ABC transporter ATP-binding protein, partial [Christensenellales bacterium]
MLEIKNVSKVYAGKKVKALDDVNIVVNSGEVFGLVGPNGAGKSTLIKLIVGMLNLDDGEISICGHSIKESPEQAKINIGFVSDNHSVYDKLSGMEFLQFVANVYEVDANEAKTEINKLVKLFELSKAINDSISSYSHGMRQKICIIASLIHKPKVWVLDEPLTGLDPKGTYNLKQLIKQEKEKGTTILFS